MENTKSPGQPRKVTGRVERVVTLASKKHPFLNSTQLRNFTKVDLSSSTIRRILVKYGLRSRICPKKPQILDKNREKRKQWAKQMLMEKTPDFWNSVIFSDEAMMELNCRRQNLVRRPNKKRYDPQFIVNSSNYARKKLMVWGCIRSNGDRLLIPIKNTR